MQEQRASRLGVRLKPVSTTRPGELVEAYRKGDPLRAIAHDYGVRVVDICDALIWEITPKDELEHYRSVRRRGLAALSSIWDNVEMVTRLNRAGIGRSEIPVVLNALGKEIDVEVAVELLHIRWIPCYDPTGLSMPIRLGDKLGLLYVIGKRHGIEPDYQLALGQMPSDEVEQLRLLATARFPPRRFAEVLAVAETTKLAIRARVATSLSLTDYDATANSLSKRFRDYISDDSDPWPPPATTLVRRFGAGCWEQALNALGLNLLKAADRLRAVDFDVALRDYAEECTDSDFPLTLEVYDRWVTAETALGGNRPSALEVIDHYGSWSAAVSQVLGSQGHEGFEQISESAGSDDARLFNCTDSALEAAWVRAGEFISELLASMPRNRSLQIQYGDSANGSIQPYAQGTRGDDGVWCEIVSERFLPGAKWPIDTEYLEARGWLVPDDEVPQWCKEKVAFHDAGHQLLKGLRFGRRCPDPWQLRWSTRQIISGSGPDNGVNMEDALAGAVQTLQNAG